MRAAHRLPVNGDHLGRQHLRHGLHPVQKTGSKLHGIQRGEDPIEGVVRGDAVGQVQNGDEPRSLDLPELLDVVPTLGPADHGTDGDDDDTQQRMQPGTLRVSLDPRVVQAGKMLGTREAG